MSFKKGQRIRPSRNPHARSKTSNGFSIAGIRVAEVIEDFTQPLVNSTGNATGKIRVIEVTSDNVKSYVGQQITVYANSFSSLSATVKIPVKVSYPDYDGLIVQADADDTRAPTPGVTRHTIPPIPSRPWAYSPSQLVRTLDDTLFTILSLS